MMNEQWENVAGNAGLLAGPTDIRAYGSLLTQRLRVPGGWIYQTIFWPGGPGGIAMVFVPASSSDDLKASLA